MPSDAERQGAIKSPEEIDAIGRAGRVVAECLGRAASACRAGVATRDIDALVRRTIHERGGEALFLGQEAHGEAAPFEGAACISINEQVVHGVPGDRVLAPGDVVTVDVGVRLDGWCADAASSIHIPAGGNDDDRSAALVRATRDALEHAIRAMAPGVKWSTIALAMESAAAAGGFGIVTEYVGHGIGRGLHEWPRVPAFATGFPGEDFVLEAGMVLAVEPIFVQHRPARARGGGLPAHATRVFLEADGWTVATEDGSWAAHEERTVVVTPAGGRILTDLSWPGPGTGV